MVSAVLSRLLLHPTRRLRHSRAENRCDRRMVVYSTTATAKAATSHPHEPQNSTAATSAQRLAADSRAGAQLSVCANGQSVDWCAAGTVIPSMPTLALICAHLDCTPDDLYEKRTLVIIGLEEPGDWFKDGAWWK